jgi:tRNA-2-methylthio-N6-dimethylallyladenosine synthase
MTECDSVCDHIHLPVQAGSDEVLKRMKRAYTRARYLDKLAMVRAAIPDIAVTTDIIVGFPGETEADFQDTLSLVEEARYDAAYMFQYSARPMTEAAEMDGHLPKEVVQERFDRLAALQESISFERNERHVDHDEEVLVEGPSKKDAAKLTGRTGGNKLVHFDTDGAEEGSFRTVRVTAAHPHHLEGRVVEGRGRPATTSRMSLPLVSAGTGCASCS